MFSLNSCSFENLDSGLINKNVSNSKVPYDKVGLTVEDASERMPFTPSRDVDKEAGSVLFLKWERAFKLEVKRLKHSYTHYRQLNTFRGASWHILRYLL